MTFSSRFDYNHATDEKYIQLRAEAREAMDTYGSLVNSSKRAYREGEHEEAKKLSNESKEFLKRAHKCNEDAANYVFQQNNMDSSQSEIDLHGLLVTEAEWIMKRTIYMAVCDKKLFINVIVGKGLHSRNHVSKLKPAMESVCLEYNIPYFIKHTNTGVMHIELKDVLLKNLPEEWSTMDYATFMNEKTNNEYGVTKPHTNKYTEHNSPQYENMHQYQNNSHYSQNQASNNHNDVEGNNCDNSSCNIVDQLIKLAISWLR